MIEPKELSEREWFEKKAEAEWLMKIQNESIANMLAQIAGVK